MSYQVVQPRPHQSASTKKPEAKPVSTTKSVFVRKQTDSVKQPAPAKVEATVKKPELVSKRTISANLSNNTKPVRKNVSSPKTLKKLPSKVSNHCEVDKFYFRVEQFSVYVG